MALRRSANARRSEGKSVFIGKLGFADPAGMG